MSAATRLIANVLFGLLGIVAVLYAAVIVYLFIVQRQMEYPGWGVADPDPTPSISGLPIEDIRIKTPDGETLQAWYEAPQPGKPIILYLHGNDGMLSGAKGRYLRIHEAGVGFLALSYRGYGLSTGRPTEQGLLIDGLAAYDWLRTKGFTGQDIVIHGHSLGSGVGVYLATKRPARALILESPFTAAVDVAGYFYPYVPVAALMEDQYLNRERIEDVHIPLLIAHGERDSVIPFEEGVNLYQLANPPKTFVRMRGSDHSTLTRDGVYQCYWKFLGLDYDAEAAHVCAPL